MAGARQPRIGRRHLGRLRELALAAAPTGTILAVFAFVEVFARQRLLFGSLASSAFLIYLDPEHQANQVKTVIVSQLGAAALGFAAFWLLGPGYAAAALAMVATIVATVSLDLVHPPAIATSLAFAFRAGNESNLAIFALAVAMVAALVVLERGTLWAVRRWSAEAT